MTGFFQLRIAAANRSLHLVHDHRHLIQARHRRLHIARSSRAPARLGLRRATAVGPATTTTLTRQATSNYHQNHCNHRSHHRRRSSSFKQLHLLQQRLEMMASHQEIRRRSSAADRTPYDTPLSPSTPIAISTTVSTTPDTALAQVKPDDEISRHQQQQHQISMPAKPADKDSTDTTTDTMPPPPRPIGDLPSGRRFTHARAQSMATVLPRHANRLSLTLPIAPTSRGSDLQPIRPPSSAGQAQPQPLSAALSSKPPTPAPTPVLPALDDANDFIIAIAAQERRVLELREDLARAEADLLSLKRQWTSKESMQKRAAEIQSQAAQLVASCSSPQQCPPTPEAMMSPSRSSVDLDRKKLWLQTQQLQNGTSSPSTPTQPHQGRRKVMRGGHARTLSLLSPVRSDTPFNLHEDNKPSMHGAVAPPLPHERMVLPPPEEKPAPSKRATWQPRNPPTSSGVPQLMEDFKLGLRAFVEDIRQITVGDEPITGPPATQRHSGASTIRTPSTSGRDRDATPTGLGRKPSTSTRSKTISARDPSKQEAGLSGSSKAGDAIAIPEKSKANGKTKQFSWTPLGFETLEDNDWTSWESPSSVKSSRWSGSTVHTGGLDEIEAIPEKAEELTATPS